MTAPTIDIEIPDPALVVLIGAAGSGKTTFAARHFAPDEVLSSDTFRELVAGDAADQRATRPAFAILHRQLERRLAARTLTVVDATNVTAFARRGLLVRALRAGLPAVAIALDLPDDLVIGRNAARPGRTVAESVVRRHLAELHRWSGDGRLMAEGFAAAYRLGTTAELDAVHVVRVRGR